MSLQILIPLRLLLRNEGHSVGYDSLPISEHLYRTDDLTLVSEVIWKIELCKNLSAGLSVWLQIQGLGTGFTYRLSSAFMPISCLSVCRDADVLRR